MHIYGHPDWHFEFFKPIPSIKVFCFYHLVSVAKARMLQIAFCAITSRHTTTLEAISISLSQASLLTMGKSRVWQWKEKRQEKENKQDIDAARVALSQHRKTVRKMPFKWIWIHVNRFAVAAGVGTHMHARIQPSDSVWDCAILCVAVVRHRLGDGVSCVKRNGCKEGRLNVPVVFFVPCHYKGI